MILITLASLLSSLTPSAQPVDTFTMVNCTTIDITANVTYKKLVGGRVFETKNVFVSSGEMTLTSTSSLAHPESMIVDFFAEGSLASNVPVRPARAGEPSKFAFIGMIAVDGEVAWKRLRTKDYMGEFAPVGAEAVCNALETYGFSM